MKKIVLISITSTLLAIACGEEGDTELIPEGAGSPAEALETVEIAFNERAIKVLASALSDNFVFHFDPDDVGQTPPEKPEYKIPASWSYNDFWPAMYNMFKNAYSVYISIYSGRIGTPGENETTYSAEKVNIRVIVMVDEISGYLAEAGYCNFEFERYESEKGEKLWRLTGWWDNTAASYDAYAGASPTSLGRVLALYN